MVRARSLKEARIDISSFQKKYFEALTKTFKFFVKASLFLKKHSFSKILQILKKNEFREIKLDELTNREDARNKLDNLFEVALVLTGVLAAALFQYMTSLPMFEGTPIQELIWNFGLGFTTFPFIFLILLWILKEVLFIRGDVLLSLRLTLICWSFWGNLLFIYLTNVIGLMQSSEFFIVLSFFLGVSPTILVAYGYKKTTTHPKEMGYFAGNRWKKEIGLFVTVSLLIMVLFFYGFLISLFLI